MICSDFFVNPLSGELNNIKILKKLSLQKAKTTSQTLCSYCFFFSVCWMTELNEEQLIILEKHFEEYGPSKTTLVFLRKKEIKQVASHLFILNIIFIFNLFFLLLE
jgi:hypothetical protein